MAHTISDGVTTITIPAIDGYEAAATSNNIIRPVVGASEPAVSFRASGLRTGELVGVLDDTDDAHDLYALLLEGAVLELTSSARPEIDMDFVTGDTVTIALDSTRAAWLVTFDWSEV